MPADPYLFFDATLVMPNGGPAAGLKTINSSSRLVNT